MLIGRNINHRIGKKWKSLGTEGSNAKCRLLGLFGCNLLHRFRVLVCFIFFVSLLILWFENGRGDVDSQCWEKRLKRTAVEVLVSVILRFLTFASRWLKTVGIKFN